MVPSTYKSYHHRSPTKSKNYSKSCHWTKAKEMKIPKAFSLSWNCDGTHLAVGYSDKTVSILNFDKTGRLSKDFIYFTHDAAINQVAFQSNKSHIFASSSDDKSICIWDIRHPNKPVKFSTKESGLYLTWSNCGRYIIFIGKNDVIQLVDKRTFNVLSSYELDKEGYELMCHPNGKHLYVCSAGGRVEILSIPDLQHIQTLQAHSNQTAIHAIEINNDGTKMAIGGYDALVSIWDIDSMTCERTMPRMDYPIRSLSFSADGNLLATSSEDSYIDIAWTADGTRRSTVPLNSEIYSIAWNPRNSVLAYNSSQDIGRGKDFGVELYAVQ